MLASFLCNGVIFGFINSYGTIYVAMKNRYEEDGFENSDTRASLLGSLLIGATFLMSPISGLLVDHIGIRKTAFLGGLLATLGAFLSSLTLDNVSFIFAKFFSKLGPFFLSQEMLLLVSLLMTP